MIPEATRAQDQRRAESATPRGCATSGASVRADRPLRILVVAFHFPPIAAAGTHRTLNFVRQLVERGHRVGVVTAGGTTGFRRDDGLLERVPKSVDVARGWYVDPFLLLARLRGHARTDAAAVPPGKAPPREGAPPSTFSRAIDWASRLLDVPDRYASWILPAFVNGIFLAGRLRPQVVYSTAPPASAHLAALLLAEVLGLPLIADLRDPWAVNPFRTVPYPSLRELDDALEALVVKRARRVILNTPLAELDYVERYGDPSKFATIQNGISPDLFDLPRAEPDAGLAIKLLHVGSIYGRRSPLPFVRALARLREERPELARRFEVIQLGPIEDGGSLIAELTAHGLSDRFVIEPAVSHAEAFKRATAAHALLLLGVSGERPEVQVPAKLFEYLAAERPILALAKRGGAIQSTLERAEADFVSADPDDAGEIYGALLRIADRVDRRVVARANGAGGASAFRYETLTARLETLLRDAVGVDDHA